MYQNLYNTLNTIWNEKKYQHNTDIKIIRYTVTGVKILYEQSGDSLFSFFKIIFWKKKFIDYFKNKILINIFFIFGT